MARAGSSPATASAVATAAAHSSSPPPTAGRPTARSAAPGTPDGAYGLLVGISEALGEESTYATARGCDHTAAVLMCLLAEVLDAQEALEWGDA